MIARLSLDELERAAETVAAAVSPSEVFRSLLEASRVGAPRRAMFLIRQGRLKGWGCTGYAARVSKRLRAFAAPADKGWLGRLIADPQSRLAFRQAADAPPDFGQPHAQEAAAVPVRAGGRTVALLLAERGERDPPLEPAALCILASMTQLRLELDLACRRLQTADAEPQAAEAEEPAGTPQPAVVGAGPEAPATGPTRESTELSPVPEASAGGAAEDPQQASARRYARLIATDIRLYNEETVALGRRHGDLAERLLEHLNRGKETFLRRYSDLGPDGLQILHEAYVKVLGAGDEKLLPALDGE